MNRHLDNQPYLGELFLPTNNAAGPDLTRAFESTPTRGAPAPIEHQLKVQARVVEYVKTHGGIDVRTVQKLGTTSGHKLLSRLRHKG
jgi:hypothetical protein